MALCVYSLLALVPNTGLVAVGEPQRAPLDVQSAADNWHRLALGETAAEWQV